MALEIDSSALPRASIAAARRFFAAADRGCCFSYHAFSAPMYASSFPLKNSVFSIFRRATLDRSIAIVLSKVDQSGDDMSDVWVHSSGIPWRLCDTPQA